MRRYRGHLLRISILPVALVLLFWNTPAAAYDQYSMNGDATNCRACHGDFRSPAYSGASDGQFWGNLHNIHRQDMLNGDCDTCHLASGRFPVMLNDSAGGNGLPSIGCVGCHGRAEDNTAANPEFNDGYGAGLRQRHFNAGVTVCDGCHQDADPANFTVASEDVLPPYYADPGINHPAMPTSSCNADGSENFAGLADGLDNDGDQAYDESDADCDVVGVDEVPDLLATLLQNVPNPFNPETRIPYRLSTRGWVDLAVYDVSGNLVRELVSSQHEAPGLYHARWDAHDRDGREVPSGIYFYRLEFGGTTQVGKMVLLK